jgi:hypothetical protein
MLSYVRLAMLTVLMEMQAIQDTEIPASSRHIHPSSASAPRTHDLFKVYGLPLELPLLQRLLGPS